MLSNFKRVAGAIKALEIDAGVSYGYAMVMMITKIDRINNLLRATRNPKNESLVDSVVDGCNYWMLMGACIEDECKETGGDKPRPGNI